VHQSNVELGNYLEVLLIEANDGHNSSQLELALGLILSCYLQDCLELNMVFAVAGFCQDLDRLGEVFEVDSAVEVDSAEGVVGALQEGLEAELGRVLFLQEVGHQSNPVRRLGVNVPG